MSPCDSHVQAGGWIAIAGVATFVIVVVALHALQSGYDPTTQLMSELAQGPHGDFMIAAFSGLAAAMVGILVAVDALGAGAAVRLLMLAAAVAFLASGIFPLGATSEIHITAIAVAFVFSGLIMYLLPSAMPAAKALVPRVVSWGLAIGLAASIALGQSVLPMAIAQRIAALFLLAWLVIVGWRCTRYSG